MEYGGIIHTKFSEPAAVLSYQDGTVKILEMNETFLPELWMNVAGDEYIKGYPGKQFDEENMRIFMDALKRCADSGKEQEVETWRKVFSDCCGFDRVCLKSRLILIENTPEGAVIYEGVRNISNEKRAQDRLDDVEYRYKKASEQINIYNWEYTIATKEMRPCYRCMRDLGLPALVTNYPEPAIDAGIFPPDYADMYREIMHQIDEGLPEVEVDIPLTVGRIPFRVKYTTEFDENGKPVKAFGSATLISEKELGRIRLDNQMISTLAEEYQCIYLLDFIQDTVRIVKQEGIFTAEENVSCGELLKLVGSEVRDLKEEQRRILCDSQTFRTEFAGGGDRREFVYRDDEGDRWIRLTYHVVEKGARGIDRLMITAAIVDDLRAQKMDADRLIATQKEELEDRQKMLIDAIDTANKANKAKTEFFSNMSHDIRTPMNAITGFSKLAVDEIDNREHLEDYLDKIVMAGDHLMSLINDILDMSRIESGKMELSLSPVKLKTLLLGCADMIRVKMDDRKLAFHVDVESIGDDVVECDKVRFNQVVLNLLSNAYKFTPEGGDVFLRGKVLRRDDRITYEIRVKDTGIGMSEEFREHIWEAYARERSEVVHETQGTGLGMVIVRNIVNLMQGTIEVQSESGKGSEFIVTLPLKPISGETAVSDQDRMTEEALKKDYTGVKVLVVDDTSVNLKLADRMLGKFGFKVTLVDSGIKAVELLRDSKPGDFDVILMDVVMPVMDGLEATKRIRSFPDPALAGIPIIAMTANAFESDVKKAMDAGMDAYIPKPYTKENLVTKINAFIGGSHHR